MKNTNFVRIAGVAGMFGAALWIVALSIEYAYDLFEPGAGVLFTANEAMFLVAQLCFLAVIAGLMRAGAAGDGWFGKISLGLFFFGWAALALAVLASMLGLSSISEFPIYDLLTLIGAVASTLGGFLAGITVVIARRLAGWKRFAPLSVGVYYVAMIPVQVVFFIGANGAPSNTLLAFWGLTWVLLGYAISSTAVQPLSTRNGQPQEVLLSRDNEPTTDIEPKGEKVNKEMSDTVGSTSTPGLLRTRLRGDAYAPGEEGYDEASKAWNLNARQRPAVVVMAEGAADVMAAVRFAREAGMGVGVMATGHGVGAPCDGGLLVNTSRMRGARVDPASRTARVEAGALWKDVIPAAAAHGLAGLAGSAPHVGVVGYTVGGGFGWLGRKYGLNSASVTEADVVTSSGELVRVSADENADLFWGLKGGGGNFGVVTSLEFRLYPLATVFGGSVFYPVEKAPEVLELYARWSAGLPDEMTTAIALMNVPPLPHLPEPLRDRSVVVVKGCYCGVRPGDGEEVFRPIREGLGQPIVDTFREMPAAEMDAISRDPVDPLGIVQRAELLSDLSPEAIDALVGVAGAGSGSPLLSVEIRRLGGALARAPEHPSPMGSGNARFSLNAIGATFTPEMAGRVRTHMARLVEATRPYRTGEVFVNFMEADPAEGRVRAAYPPEDWERLVALKDEHDPQNLFRFNRNIPPSPSAQTKEASM